jgi:hypothetical protein
VKLNSWQEIGSDGDVWLTPYVPKGITGYDDDDDDYNKCTYDFTYSTHYFCHTFLILRRIQPDIIINVHRTSRTVHVTFVTHFSF